MSIYHIELLGRDDNSDILNILRSSPNVTDKLSICFDRQPDFFRLAEIRYNPFQYYGYFRDDELKGICGIGYHNAMINSKPATVFHMRDYYVMKESRGLGFGLKVCEKFFTETWKNVDTGYIVILTGNRASLGYVGRRNDSFPYMPYSRIINQQEVRNIMIIWPVLKLRKYKIRRARSADIPDIVNLLNHEHHDRLFGKIYNIDTFQECIDKSPGLSINDYYLALDKDSKICGVCAAWNCHEFKQTRVLSYGKHFRLPRIAYTGLSFVFNVPSLPTPGQCFRDIILNDYAVRGRNPEILNALIRAIYIDARAKKYHSLLIGSSVDDPLLKATEGFFFQRIVSNIVLVSRKRTQIEDGAIRNNLPFIDLATL